MSSSIPATTVARAGVVDNASLAAILSVPAKDKRTAGRGVYRPFGAREDEQEEIAAIARATLVVELVEVG